MYDMHTNLALNAVRVFARKPEVLGTLPSRPPQNFSCGLTIDPTVAR